MGGRSGKSISVSFPVTEKKVELNGVYKHLSSSVLLCHGLDYGVTHVVSCICQ